MIDVPTVFEIREARRRAGLTQAQAAKTVYAGVRTWHRWESGKQKIPLAEWELFLRKQFSVTSTGFRFRPVDGA